MLFVATYRDLEKAHISSALILTALSSISLTRCLTSGFSTSPLRHRVSIRSREFQVCPWTFAADDLIVGLALPTWYCLATTKAHQGGVFDLTRMHG